MERVEIKPEIEKAAEKAAEASEKVVDAFEKVNKEGTISAENEKILNDALQEQFQSDMDFAEKDFKSKNGRDMTAKEVTDLYNNFKDLYKVENGKVSDAVRNISLNNPELAKLIDDMIRENAKTALNSPVFANMETELANFDFDLTDDNFQNKIKILLDNRIYRKKFNNIVEYLQSPRSNLGGMAAAFTAWELLHDIKMDILGQLDLQHPGQEGWVMATPVGYAKAVNRFDPNAFAAQNRQRNNPQQA